jgi:hypothetical protein
MDRVSFAWWLPVDVETAGLRFKRDAKRPV